MKIICDACGAKYSIADEKVSGKTFKIRCKKCSNIVIVRGAAAEEAAPAAEADDTDGIWHLVINQEQVGPMTVEAVGERFQQGEINSSSYVWREGFDDWARIVDVPEFAEVVAASAAQSEAEASQPSAAAAETSAASTEDAGFSATNGAGERIGSDADSPARSESESESSNDLFGSSDNSGASGGLFGPATDQSSPSDAGGLFASSPAASSTEASSEASSDASSDVGGGGGLFGDSVTGGSSPSGARASTSQPGSGGMFDSPAPATGGDMQVASQSLKGQRNDSSVLFSLNNLAALAGDSPTADAAPAASAPSATSTTDGSGLIDIRSMAQVYLGENSAGTMDNSPADLPVFTQNSFETAVPVLLPNQSEEGGNKKLMVILLGAIGILVAVVGLLAYKAFSGPGSESAAGQDASDKGSDTQVATNAGIDDGNSDIPDAPGVGDTDSQAENADPTQKKVEALPTDAADKTAKDDSKNGEKKRDSKSRDDKKTSKRDSRDDDKAKRDVVATDTSRRDSKSSSNDEDCGEVACLVDSSRACCKKYSGGSSSKKSNSGSSKSNLPERLSRNDIKSGMGGIRGRVASCSAKNNFKGRVNTKIKIGGSGRVSNVSATGGPGAVNSCVSKAVKSARFPKTQEGASFSYPFIL